MLTLRLTVLVYSSVDYLIWSINVTQDNRIGSGLAEHTFLGAATVS